MVRGAFLALGVWFLVQPALAQQGDVSVLLDRLDRLERDIQTLHQEMAAVATRPAGQAPQPAPVLEVDSATPAAARLSVRLSTVEQELRQMTGAVEAINHRFDQINTRLDKLIGDVDFRLSTIEGVMGRTPQAAMGEGASGLQSAPSPASVEAVATPPVGQAEPTGAVDEDGVYVGSTGTLGTISQGAVPAEAASQGGDPQEVTPAPIEVASVLPQGSVQERYKFAFGLLGKMQFDQAETAFQEFLKAHSDDALAGNAHYWLGETYYVRKQYAQAAAAFLEGYKAFPKGNKAPDSLLKLGMSLSGLGKKKEACAAFDQLSQAFSEPSATIAKTLARVRKDNGCS